MNKRISLVEGIRRDQETIDPVVEQNFLKYGTVKPPVPIEPAEEPPPVERTYEPRVEDQPLRRARSSKVTPVGLIPVTVRLAGDRGQRSSAPPWSGSLPARSSSPSRTSSSRR